MSYYFKATNCICCIIHKVHGDWLTSACQFIPEAVTQLHRSMPAHYDQLITDTCGGVSLFVHWAQQASDYNRLDLVLSLVIYGMVVRWVPVEFLFKIWRCPATESRRLFRALLWRSNAQNSAGNRKLRIVQPQQQQHQTDRWVTVSRNISDTRVLRIWRKIRNFSQYMAQNKFKVLKYW